MDSIDYGSISFSESGPHQQSRGMAFVDMAVFANIAVFRIAFPPIINFKRLRAGARCIFFRLPNALQRSVKRRYASQSSLTQIRAKSLG
ncbi:MAG: hypothetical protein H6962_08975 [Chromatiaceae bacterium]|nr:hypothetical protein [Chromatiaceae bacterium]